MEASVTLATRWCRTLQAVAAAAIIDTGGTGLVVCNGQIAYILVVAGEQD